MTEMSAGRAVVELLKAEGVRHVFGIVGSTFLDVLDVLHDDRSVEYVNVRHEQGGAFMADGLARVTGQPAVCLVTSGPGATNLVTGIAGAYVAHSPVVAIAGGSPLGQQGRDAFQELDLVALFRPVTKLSIQVTQPGAHPRDAPPRLPDRDDRTQGPGVRRHPAGRAERPGGPDGHRRARSLPADSTRRRRIRRRSARRCACSRGPSGRSCSSAAA